MTDAGFLVGPEGALLPQLPVTLAQIATGTGLAVATPAGIVDQSGNLAAGALTAAQAAMLVASQSPRLTQIPYVASGLTLPSSGSLTNTIASGDATINGVRVIMPATAITLPASKDNYIDLTQAGAYVVTSVANGATTGFPLTANSLRLGYISTGASSITSMTTGAKDALGNWLGNEAPNPIASLFLASSQVFNAATATVAFGTGTTEIYDNAFQHSIATNNTRLTVAQQGIYQVNGCVTWVTGGSFVVFGLNKNGSGLSAFPAAVITSGGAFSAAFNGIATLNAADYLEMSFNPGSADLTLSNAWFSMARIG